MRRIVHAFRVSLRNARSAVGARLGHAGAVVLRGRIEAECCNDAQLLATAVELGFRECLIECFPDWSCVRDCELAYPGGVAAWNDLFSCVVGPCGDACTGGDYCGTIGLSGGDCTDCAVAKCCEAFEACSQDVACMDYFFCHTDSEDQDAFIACALGSRATRRWSRVPIRAAPAPAHERTDLR